MPYRNEVQPLNLFGDYVAGRQAGLEQQRAQQVNALGGLQVQRQQAINALGQNPNATPEQYVRAGDVQTGAALDTLNQRGQIDKQQAVQQLAGIAQKALTITDPAQRKSFLQQAGQVYGPAFQALGADMSQFPQMLAMPDDALAQKLQQVAQFAAPQKPIEVQAGGSLVNPTTFQPVYTAPQKPSVTYHDAGDRLVPTNETGAVVPGLDPIKKGQTPNASAKTSASVLSPEGIDLAAQEYLNTGKLPAGMGGAQTGMNSKIISRAAAIAAANGNDAQAAALNRASFKSAQTGLTALTKQRTLVGAFERTALKNLEIAVDESAKVDRTGVPALNRWLLAGKKNLTGDVEVGRFNAALTSALNEYAKVLSGATGAAGISDAARREAEELLSTANTPEQVTGIVEIMKREMANREAGFAEQEAQLKETMSGRPAVGVAPAERGAPLAPGAPAVTPADTAQTRGSANKVLTYDPATGAFK